MGLGLGYRTKVRFLLMPVSVEHDLPPDPPKARRLHPSTDRPAHPCDARVLGRVSDPRYGQRCQHGAYSRVLTLPERIDGTMPDLVVQPRGTQELVPRWLCSAHFGVWFRAGHRLPDPNFFWSEKKTIRAK